MWNEDIHSSSAGKSKRFSMGASREANDDGEKKFFQRQSKDWKIGLFQHEKAGSSGKPARAITGDLTEEVQLAIEDKGKPMSQKQWQMAEAQLATAIAAYQKITAEGRKLITALDEKQDPDMYQSVRLGLCIQGRTFLPRKSKASTLSRK